MSKRGDNKRQKSILNYFIPRNNTVKIENKECLAAADSVVTDSLEAMTLEVAIKDDPKFQTTEKKDSKPIADTNNIMKEKEEESEEEEEEEEVNISRNKRKRRLRRVIEEESSTSSDNDSDADIPISVRLTKLKQNHQKQQQQLSFMKQKDQEEEKCDEDSINDEELDFLDKSDILQERTRGKKVSRYTEALKKLANRKSKLDSYQGERGPIEKYSTKVQLLRDNSDLDTGDMLEEDSDDIEIDSDIEDGSNNGSGVDESDDNSDGDLEGFVVDDDIIDGEKNAGQDSEMTMMEMPAEFTKARTNSFSKQLKIYLEYLVALSISPFFDINSNRQYAIAKSAVVRRVQSYKDSIVTSDVWLTSFKKAVDKYPHWTILPPENLRDSTWDIEYVSCEACRSNKPASERVLLSSEESPSSIILYLGSECCRKGQLYHQLYHFELHMYNKVKSKVVTEMMSDRLLRLKDNSSNSKQQQTSMVYNNLRKSGNIKRLRKQVRDLFNTVILIYNLRSQRSRIVEDSSSSGSSSSCNSDNDHYSSSED